MGWFNGSIEEQMRILEAAIAAGAKAVDLEIESAEDCRPRLEALRSHAYVLLSYHNYGGTPPIEAVLRRMQRVPADGYKVVTTAKKPSDNYKVLEIARAYPSSIPSCWLWEKPGSLTRVLSPGFGGIYTYAAPNAAAATASGQASARQLRNLYRVEKISRDAKIYGVIADPPPTAIPTNDHVPITPACALSIWNSSIREGMVNDNNCKSIPSTTRPKNKLRILKSMFGWLL